MTVLPQIGNLTKTLTAGAGALFAWWIAELAGVIPAILRRRFATPRLCIQLNGDQLELTLNNAAGVKPVYRGPVDQAAVASALRAASGRARFLPCLKLNRQDALIREVELPAAARPRLREALAFEISRQTPFSADEVYFGYSAVRQFNGRLQTRLAVTERVVVDDIVGRLYASGIGVEAVEIEPAQVAAEVIHLGGAVTATAIDRISRAATVTLLLSALLLSVAFVHIEVSRQERVLTMLQDEIGRERKGAVEAESLKSELAEAKRRYRFISEQLSRKSVSDTVEQLSGILPDNIWLSQLTLQGNHARLTGYAPDPTAVIELLERSGSFANAQFRSPIVRRGSSSVDRFEISVEWTGAKP